MTLGDYRFTVTFIDPWTPRAQQRIGEHGGLILRIGPEDYLVAGEGITVTVAPADGRGAAGIDSAWEGRFEGGRLAGRAACSTATKPTRAATSACLRAGPRSSASGSTATADRGRRG